MTIEEKLSIARGIVTPLLRKIRAGKYKISCRLGHHFLDVKVTSVV
jgi:hypothetical protein